MAKQKRDVLLKVRVTPEERALIRQKMALLGTDNMAAYMRKMAIDGYVVKLDLPELRELVSLLRYSSNKLNQLARRCMKQGAFTPRIWMIYSKIRSGSGRRQAVSCLVLLPSGNGVFIPCGGGLLRAGRPCFFVPRHPCNLEHIPVSCSHKTNERRKKRCAFF